MRTYKIIDDSGVDYGFIKGFGYDIKSWKGQIVKGNPSHIQGCITVEKPFGMPGTWTADASYFEEIKTNPE